ncbi:hypothetical protein D3C85_1138240 [compost metagenome]
MRTAAHGQAHQALVLGLLGGQHAGRHVVDIELQPQLLGIAPEVVQLLGGCLTAGPELIGCHGSADQLVVGGFHIAAPGIERVEDRPPHIAGVEKYPDPAAIPLWLHQFVGGVLEAVRRDLAPDDRGISDEMQQLIQGMGFADLAWLVAALLVLLERG